MCDPLFGVTRGLLGWRSLASSSDITSRRRESLSSPRLQLPWSPTSAGPQGNLQK